jgi:hypothetical protein
MLTHALVRLSPSRYFRGACDQLRWQKNQSPSHPMRKDMTQLLEWQLRQGKRRFSDNGVFSPAIHFSLLSLDFRARP